MRLDPIESFDIKFHFKSDKSNRKEIPTTKPTNEVVDTPILSDVIGGLENIGYKHKEAKVLVEEVYSSGEYTTSEQLFEDVLARVN